jgi:hypothetical protein
MYGDNRSAPAADVDMVGGGNNKKQFARFFLIGKFIEEFPNSFF